MKQLLLLLTIVFFAACSGSNRDQTTPADTPNVIIETTINIGGMHCDMCVASVTKGVTEVEGVQAVTVDLADSTATVSYSSAKVDLATIEKAIEKRGYSIKDGQ